MTCLPAERDRAARGLPRELEHLLDPDQLSGVRVEDRLPCARFRERLLQRLRHLAELRTEWIDLTHFPLVPWRLPKYTGRQRACRSVMWITNRQPAGFL